MIVDLHAHYPMHVSGANTLARMTAGNSIRAFILTLANRLANYPKPGEPAVTIPNLKAGGVGVVLSVLYQPLDEIDLDEKYGAPPRGSYFVDLEAQIAAVETNVAHFGADAAVVTNRNQLDAARAQGKVALIHAVEGGFHLGDTPQRVRDNVARLAGHGVAYVTLAHLFWRDIATNAPALPFLPDWLYQLLFPQPAKGLSNLGLAALDAMVEQRILIDLTHMSGPAMTETLDRLDTIDPQRRVPVVATHGAYAFGGLKYNLRDAQLEAIAARRGVVGLIACKHYMTDGLSQPSTFDDTIATLCRHIDKIHDVTGSYDAIAFGSDLDGFIKPTLPGLETPAAFASVEARLTARYGAAIAEQVCSANALRVLQYWGA
ncbi:MAG TPA: membrane dipeptidase [Gemmatimonadales bacterium]|nr:membrane dipeptidase [Gemmatimonadales bacterium]